MKKITLVLFVMAMIIGYHPDLFAQKKNRKAESAAQPAADMKPEAQKQVQAATVVPVIVNGEAQKIPAFENAGDWIREDLWVETEFDTDGDGKNDRMHVDVTRPKQTDTEGIKLPVVYESSPYFAGTAGNNKEYFWNVRQELNTVPKPHIYPPQIERRGERPVISNSQVKAWLPYGFAVVHSSAPGTGLSQGCPTIGTRIEALAPKAVIDWLNGRAKGYTTPDGSVEVKAYWATGKVGMIGTSYNGTIPFAAATTGVEGLEAIIPVAQYIILSLLPLQRTGQKPGRIPG